MVDSWAALMVTLMVDRLVEMMVHRSVKQTVRCSADEMEAQMVLLMAERRVGMTVVSWDDI